MEDINKGIEQYLTSWEKLVDGRAQKAFFAQLKPVAVGWKVADRAEYDVLYAQLHDKCDRIIETWMNGRWVAKLHLRDESLAGNITIIKIMQRRPGSSDAVGLDHLDFYSKETAIQEAIEKESDLKWSLESNDVIAGYGWLSIWFDNTEAKIKSNTVMDIIIEELQEINNELKA